MLKKLAAIVLTAVLIFALSACEAEADTGLTRVRLNQVVHSIFYAPQYAAISLGFFEDEGIEIVLTTGQGADRTMTALITGEADIGLMGTEAALYVFNEGLADFAIAFAQPKS